MSRRDQLVKLLRDPSQWPEGFVWYYGDHATCAIGLYAAMVGEDARDKNWTDDRMRVDLGLTLPEFHAIFYQMHWGMQWPRASRISASDVAAALEPEAWADVD